MFDTKIENKESKVTSFSPSNLKLVKDRQGNHFVFQLECITSIVKFWNDQDNECTVVTSLGQNISVSMAVVELYAELIK
ncbi:hypothetical protein [Lelliottia amnigena]|jgi:cell wall assembly regulator SMI1|uniref:hypothetical protein n=1 Tax=Lelliottia amnigena TaxID=61646 RepID=UPI001C24B100|nr:hypothetical protein [Lelliottia amnigena]QXB24169.1 hypothetical protein I6L76_23175 [Lelliottia amnigena]